MVYYHVQVANILLQARKWKWKWKSKIKNAGNRTKVKHVRMYGKIYFKFSSLSTSLFLLQSNKGCREGPNDILLRINFNFLPIQNTSKPSLHNTSIPTSYITHNPSFHHPSSLPNSQPVNQSEPRSLPCQPSISVPRITR